MIAPRSMFKAPFSQPLEMVMGALATQRSLLWGGSVVVALGLGYGMAHLPNPIECLGWAGLGGLALWSFRTMGKRSQSVFSVLPATLTAEQVQQLILQTRTQLEQLIQEGAEACANDNYDTRLNEIEQGLGRTHLSFQIVGTRGVGKTTLQNRLMEQSSPFYALWQMAADPQDVERLTSDSAAFKQTDVVLFVVQGDLTQPEWTALQQIDAQHKRILLLLNKQDQYLPAQADLVLAQIKQRVKGVVAAEDIMAITTQPQPFKVRQHQEDGTSQDRWETPQPQLQPLTAQMHQIATQDRLQLVLQQAYQQTLAVQADIQTDLNQLRRDRALPLIERYQWIAAGAAFATPMPSLDMVATAAITGKLIQELAQIYHLQLSVERATEIAGVLAKMLIKMGLVEASTQLLSPFLKGNAVTFVAGGTLQGVGAAYFTRIAGLSLIELFEVSKGTGTAWQIDPVALGQIIQRLFTQHQKLGVFKDLVQQTLRRLSPTVETAIAAS